MSPPHRDEHGREVCVILHSRRDRKLRRWHMQVVHARACGLDVHKKTVVACVLLTAEDGTVQRLVRTFSTMTADLLALADWLDQLEVTHVAMESTGVFWW